MRDSTLYIGALASNNVNNIVNDAGKYDEYKEKVKDLTEEIQTRKDTQCVLLASPVLMNRKKTERKVETVHRILIRSRVLQIRRRAGSPMQSTDRSSRSRTRAAIGRKNRTLHVVQNRT